MSRSINASTAGRVLVIIEVSKRRVAPVTWELLTCGRAAAEALGLSLSLVVLGESAGELGAEVAAHCGEAVEAIKVPGMSTYSGEVQRWVLARLAPDLGASVVIGGHTTTGMDWAPGLAAILDAAFISAVEAIESDGQGLTLSRACHFGKLNQQLRPTALPLVMTVQPGCFKPAEAAANGPGALHLIEVNPPPCRVRVRDQAGSARGDAALAQAQVVVAAGRGVGQKENLAMLRDLAALFSNAALAGSRPICDQGWLGYQRQVGLTGSSVSPKLYLACGISGARQHIMGMQSSEFVVAVNSDPAAPIFNHSDVCVVEDLNEFIPALLALAKT